MKYTYLHIYWKQHGISMEACHVRFDHWKIECHLQGLWISKKDQLLFFHYYMISRLDVSNKNERRVTIWSVD